MTVLSGAGRASAVRLSGANLASASFARARVPPSLLTPFTIALVLEAQPYARVRLLTPCLLCSSQRVPLQQLQPGGPGVFRRGNISLGVHASSLLWQEETSTEEALASSPFAQWCLAVSKPVLQHGISRRDFFIGGQKALRCFEDPVCENALNFSPAEPRPLRCPKQARQ